MKRILSVQDISCIGKCSQGIAIPIISVLGSEVCMLPVSLLSCHTAFDSFTFDALTDQVKEIIHNWQKKNIIFDGIYVGYLGSLQLIEIAEQIIDLFSDENTFILVDPAMGDHGRLYSGIDECYPEKIKKLVEKADIITPNLTESELLTGNRHSKLCSISQIEKIADSLSEICRSKAAITGIPSYDNKLIVYASDFKSGNSSFFETKHYDRIFHGTGDIFASTLAGLTAKGVPFIQSVEKAVSYISVTLRKTVEDKNARWYGVNFEETLSYLINK